jgi:hypothetical protein
MAQVTRHHAGYRHPLAPRPAGSDDSHPGGTAEFDPGRGQPTSGGRGWASHRRNQARAKRSFGHPDEFKVALEDTTYLIKPLEDEPFWSYCEHFISEITDGSRSFTCGGDQCPLCNYGDVPRAYDLFNIAVWEPDADSGRGGWALKFWRATPDPAGKVLARAEELGSGKNPKTLGDPDIYLAVSKSPSSKRKDGRSFNEFQVDIVKQRDLDEDYDAFPLPDEDYEEFTGRLFDETVVKPASLRDLRAAAGILDGQG